MDKDNVLSTGYTIRELQLYMSGKVREAARARVVRLGGGKSSGLSFEELVSMEITRFCQKTTDSGIAGVLPPITEEEVRVLGISREDAVVLYSKRTGVGAVWALEVMLHEDRLRNHKEYILGGCKIE